MHHISETRIQNFKSISDGTFPLSYYTPLVGYNNAGKTNIIRAVAWVIKKSSLTIEDFYQVDQPVIVEAEIVGITDDVLVAIGDAHRRRIEPLIVNGCIRIRRTQAAPGQSASSIRLEVLQRENNDEIWVANPTGIDAAIAALFPDPIFIGAMENATEDVGKFGSSTTIGKLLKEIMGPVIERYSPTVAIALQDIGQKLSSNAVDKDETLLDLDERIQGELSKLFPGVSARTHIPLPEFSDFMKAATIRIFEDGYEDLIGRDASSFGHGAQRSIQIALVKCLADVRKAAGGNAGRTTLLLIDEPELYLHPQAVEVVRAALSRLSGDGYQVLITTHSANMISCSDAPNALLVRRTAADGTKCYTRIKDAVTEAIASAEHQSETLFALSNSSKILFSERVGIVEGKTERTLLPTIFQDECGLTPDEDKIGLVDIGGTPNIPDAMKVLNAMGVPTKAIVDLDFAFRIAPIKGLINPNHVDIIACKAVLVELRDAGDIGLDGEGLPRSHNGAPATAAFELLANNTTAIPCIERLHEELKACGIWLWSKGAVEAHLGIAKTNAARRTFLQEFSNPAYKAAMPDYDTVRDAIAWLRD
ncbi:ATP-dependent endonuclease [Sulfitobacter sp.]|uniref:ATP-dependent nuclease n=1 Tax=Sulfitobacter sp. TaxID=1903071 RepID=UPI0035696219